MLEHILRRMGFGAGPAELAAWAGVPIDTVIDRLLNYESMSTDHDAKIGLAEYVGIVVIAALTTVLFLGGWKGPFDDQLGWLWTLVKIFAVSFVIIWLRVSYPRLREDQLQRLCWLVLVPVALGQLVLTAAVKVAL